MNQQEPIAIIGIGCRFPGRAHGIERFWSILEQGDCVIKPTPPQRWSLARHFDPDLRAPRRTYTNEGGYLEDDIERFDAAAFNISPREAAAMDPQQRVLLEVTAEAIEDANIARNALAGTNTGVYFGTFTVDYQSLMLRPSNVHLVDSHTAAGMSLAAISNRISHVFDLCGPSLSIDTACSASLVALHYACKDLRDSSVDLAISGGVNISLLPEFLFALCKGSFLSPQARSKAFDIAANGYARGEGAGVMILKPLSAAQADGDAIHGLIHASGINQDGHTDGISRPNVEAQKKLIHQVYGLLDISPRDLAFVETHGTGTQIGDQVEAQAIGETIGQHRDSDDPILLGTLKPNIGHLESAAGVASVIKSVLALKHGVLPKNPLLTEPNPAIDFIGLNLRVPYENEPLFPEQGQRFAGINGFGYGGTNAHVVVSVQDDSQPVLCANSDSNVLFLSAHSDELLRKTAMAHGSHLSQSQISSTAHCTASARLRSDGLKRLAIVAQTKADLIDELYKASQNQPSPNIYHQTQKSLRNVVFAFSGMGAQYSKMGVSLFERYPVFAQALERIDQIFLDNWKVSPLALLRQDELPVDRSDVVQWTNFTLQVALCELLDDWGIVPCAMIGHSAGEVAAAWHSGCLSLKQACAVAYHRGIILNRLSGKGRMLAAGISQEQAMKYLKLYPELDLAAVNGPHSVTFSGPTEQTLDLQAKLSDLDIFVRILNTSVPYHSRAVDSLGNIMCEDLASLTPKSAQIDWISTVNPELPAVPNARYWAQNARQTVKFYSAANILIERGETLFIEIGAHPVLSREILECANIHNTSVTSIATLRRDVDAQLAMDRMRAALFASGGQADWLRSSPVSPKIHGALPLQVWDNTRFFLESWRSEMQRRGPADHPLLGAKLTTPDAIWEAKISALQPAFLSGHCVLGKVIFPAASYLEIGLACALSGNSANQAWLQDISFITPLVLPKDTEITLSSKLDSCGTLTIKSIQDSPDEQAWTTHAQMKISAAQTMFAQKRDISRLTEAMTEEVALDEFYQQLDSVGLAYSDEFRQFKKLYRGEKIAISIFEINSSNSMHLDPRVLDGAFQTALSLLPQMQLILPKSADSIMLLEKPSGTCYAVAHIRNIVEQQVMVDIELLTEDGRLLAAVENLQCAGLPRAVNDISRNWLYYSKWSQLPKIDDQALANNLLVHSDPLSMDFLEMAAQAQVSLVNYNQALLQVAHTPQDAIFICPQDDKEIARHLHDFSQFILSYPAEANARIVVVTQDCQLAVSGDAVNNPWQAGFWGTARSLALDFPNLHIRLLDLPARPTLSSYQHLFKFCATYQADEIAVRSGGGYAHSIKRLSVKDYDDNKLCLHRPCISEPVILNTDSDSPIWEKFALAETQQGEIILKLDAVAVAPEFENHYDAIATVLRDGIDTKKLAVSGGNELLSSHLLCNLSKLITVETNSETPLALTLCSRLENVFKGLAPDTPVVFDFGHLQNIKAVIGWMINKPNPFALLYAADKSVLPEDIKLFHPDAFETRQELKQFLGEKGLLIQIVNTAKVLNAPVLHNLINDQVLDLSQIEPDHAVADQVPVFTGPVTTIEPVPKASQLVDLTGTSVKVLYPNAARLPTLINPLNAANTKGVGLVTGGLSGVGSELAKSLITLGYHAIALIGRRGMDTPGANQLVQTFTSQGVDVKAIACDVTDIDQITDVLNDLRAEFGAINAVFHAAGQVDNTSPQNLTHLDFTQALAAKCKGAMILSELTNQDELLCFCTIGSVAGLLGNRNQAPYAAANAILTALTAQRRARSLPAFNAVLGAVNAMGVLAEDEALNTRLQSIGVQAMDCQVLLQRLHEMNQLDTFASNAIMDMDWSMWGIDDRPFSPISQLITNSNTIRTYRSSLKSVSQEDLDSIIKAALSSIAQIEVDKITDDTAVSSFGLDSLGATDVSVYVQSATGLVLDPIDIISGKNVRSLSKLLAQKLSSDATLIH